MTLLEAIFHETDFITSNVPGCCDLAIEFQREMWTHDAFSAKMLFKYKPKPYDSDSPHKFKKYLFEEVKAEYYQFLKTNFIDRLSVYDFSNTNKLHRRALLAAVGRVNCKPPKIRNNIKIVVSTRNMIKVLPKVIFGRLETIINIVGFGRLYTDYGVIGRGIFNLIVCFHDRTTAHAFIVEHDADKAILDRLVTKPVYATHGDGLDVFGFKRQRPTHSKILRIGYLSRFHHSKGTHEILKIAKNLPADYELIIAGWDIKGNTYSRALRKIIKYKDNVKFLGRLNEREDVSHFFNRIDLFLSPSVREGGNIALQEAIWHGVPFVTTDVPGCKILADIFGCPAIEMNDFGNKILRENLRETIPNTSNWNKKKFSRF